MKFSIAPALAAAAAAALLLGTAAEAPASPSNQTYIGLYADSARTAWCAEGCTSFCPLTIYVWVLPSYRGVQNVEFDVSLPSSVIAFGGQDLNCAASINWCLLPVLGPFYSFSFSSCQSDWVWVFRTSLFLTASSSGEGVIVPAPDRSQITYASCEPGWPVYPMTPLNVFYFGACGPLAVESSSWGSIKALFR